MTKSVFVDLDEALAAWRITQAEAAAWRAANVTDLASRDAFAAYERGAAIGEAFVVWIVGEMARATPPLIAATAVAVFAHEQLVTIAGSAGIRRDTLFTRFDGAMAMQRRSADIHRLARFVPGAEGGRA